MGISLEAPIISDLREMKPMKLASGFCIPEPLPVHTGIKGRQVHPLIKFYAVEPRTSPWQPAMFQDCGMGT